MTIYKIRQYSVYYQVFEHKQHREEVIEFSNRLKFCLSYLRNLGEKWRQSKWVWPKACQEEKKLYLRLCLGVNWSVVFCIGKRKMKNAFLHLISTLINWVNNDIKYLAVWKFIWMNSSKNKKFPETSDKYFEE